MAGLDTSELAKPIQALTRVLLDAQSEKQHEQEQPVDTTAQDTVREIEKLVMALESKEFSFIHQTDPQLVALVTSLTAALEKKLEPVLQSIENRALIDLDIWERLKNLAGDIAELRGQAPDD